MTNANQHIYHGKVVHSTAPSTPKYRVLHLWFFVFFLNIYLVIFDTAQMSQMKIFITTQIPGIETDTCFLKFTVPGNSSTH